MSLANKKYLAQYLEIRPWLKHRKYKYKIIADLLCISENQAKLACIMNRRIQELLPNDEKGQGLEKEFRDYELGQASVFEMIQQLNH